MVTCHRRHLEARCKQRGYRLADVMDCVVRQDGDIWTIDEGHPKYPREKAAVKGGPGTELTKILETLGLGYLEGCKCKQRARQMDEWGPDGCLQNLSTIVGWLEEEAKNRKLPFIRWGARTLVLVAIRRARKHKRQASGT